MKYKENWEETKTRYRDWWNHENRDRCLLSIKTRKANASCIPPPPEPASIRERWYDLDSISQRELYRMETLFFGAETLPIWSSGYSGLKALPTLLGCPVKLSMSTGWWDPILNDPDEISRQNLSLNEDTEEYKLAMNSLRRGVQESRGKSLVSVGALGGSGDTLAGLRGTEQLLMDCIERPHQVRETEEFLMDIWIDFYDRCYEIIRKTDEGSCGWFPLWAPGKFYAVQNDFSFNVGPDMFRDIFLPVIKRQIEFLDYAVYHVDGVNSFVHVDALCELPGLQALQILPGAGKPSPLHYLDILKKVQKAGKNLHISISANELEIALSELSSRGLFISTVASSETEARELISKAEKLSKF